MRNFFVSSVLVLFVFLSGCTGSRQAVETHPMAGEWTYLVESDEGIFKGILAFTPTDDALLGTIRGEGADERMPLSNVQFEAPQLSFEFTSPEYGLLKVSVTVEDDAFSGWMEVPDYGTSVPISGGRVVSA